MGIFVGVPSQGWNCGTPGRGAVAGDHLGACPTFKIGRCTQQLGINGYLDASSLTRRWLNGKKLQLILTHPHPPDEQVFEEKTGRQVVSSHGWQIVPLPTPLRKRRRSKPQLSGADARDRVTGSVLGCVWTECLAPFCMLH